MSMRPTQRNRDGLTLHNACRQRTVCEVLREVNDLHQGDTQTDITTRYLIREAVDMAKRMDRKLKEYNKSWDRDWWEENPDYEADFERRVSTDYLALDEMPQEVRRIPSMGGREIGRHLRGWAADMPDGFVAVELGAWLGSGTAQMAMGLRDAGSRGKVHAYDRFRASQSEIEKARAQGVELPPHADTSWYVMEAMGAAKLGRYVALHKGEIPPRFYDEGPIGLHVDDACKREAKFLGAIRRFGPSWVANVTIVVLMDVWYFERKPTVPGLRFQHDWLNAHRESFETIMERMPGTSATALRYVGGNPWEW